MADYIEREAVLAEAYYDGNFNLVIPAKKVRNIPAADVAPVRNGRWINHTMIDGHIHAECSECHKVRIIDNYCPNCGCRMDGGVE